MKVAICALLGLLSQAESYALTAYSAARLRDAATSRGITVRVCASPTEHGSGAVNALHRRSALLAGAALVVTGRGAPAEALVKGVAPPEGYGRGGGKRDLALDDNGKRITNKQDALEIGRSREAKMFDKDDGKFEQTDEGDRFRDIIVGTGVEAAEGSTVSIKYRVLRLGKRSRDGLSGEASLVFSYGYGEDDDKESDVLDLTVGDSGVVPALDAAIYGMKEGGKRRISVRPERGWRRSDSNCAGRDIGKTVDVGTAIGLPGGQVTETESCMDTSLVPSPNTFQAKRKLSRRFDESLLMEVELVKVKTAGDASRGTSSKRNVAQVAEEDEEEAE